MNNLYLIKIGGSAITDKTKEFTPDTNTMKRLSSEIKEALEEDNSLKIVVGHGSGSFGHTAAHKYQTKMGIINEESYKGISEVQDAASRLNRIFVRELIDGGVNAISVQPSAFFCTEEGDIVDCYDEPIKLMLSNKLVPVPYGDIALDRKIGCTIISTEKILSALAKKTDPKRIIIGAEVDGVFKGNPHEDPNVELIPLITNDNFENIKKFLQGARGTDVTGGMIHKVEEMLKLANQGFEVEIINLKKSGYLKRALLGEVGLGTIIRK